MKLPEGAGPELRLPGETIDTARIDGTVAKTSGVTAYAAVRPLKLPLVRRRSPDRHRKNA